jgi:hypothetical protein
MSGYGRRCGNEGRKEPCVKEYVGELAYGDIATRAVDE